MTNYSLSQMLGLVVNSFVETSDYDEANVHRSQASKMDILDILPSLAVRSVTPLASRTETAAMDTDSDTEAGPSNTPRAQTPPDNVVRDPLTGLYILGVSQHHDEDAHVTIDTPFGTPTSRVGLPSTLLPSMRGQLRDRDGAGPSRGDDFSASSGEEETPPARTQLPAIDVLDMRSRPSLDLYRENRRRRNKVPYVEFGINDVVVISDEDEEEIKMYDMVRGVPEGPATVKKEAMTVAELDEKMAKRMNDEIAQRISENNQEHALKMAAIQLELERQRKESQEMHAQLMGYFAQLTARPQVVFATSPEGSHGPTLAMPAPSSYMHYPPPPQGVQPQPPAPIQPSIPVLPRAEAEEDELRTRVRNSAGHSPLPIPGSIPLVIAADDDSTSFTIVRRGLERSGHDSAKHTERVEDSQESPTPSGQPDERMEDTQGTPQEHVDTQASHAPSTEMDMDTEVLVEVTGARPYVHQGNDEGGSAGTSPPHAEVTNLA